MNSSHFTSNKKCTQIRSVLRNAIGQVVSQTMQKGKENEPSTQGKSVTPPSEKKKGRIKKEVLEIVDTKDSPFSEYTSEIAYDSKSALCSLCYLDIAQFWALVNSQEWRTAIRIGRGHLQRRILFLLHELLKKDVAWQFASSQKYNKVNLGRKLGDKWIPDHRLLSEPRKDVSMHQY